MTNLSKQVKRTAKSASLISGTITDVSGSKASVRLSSNGAVMKNMNVIGGPVTIGQSVDVSFTSTPAFILAYSGGGITSNDASKIVDTARTPFIISAQSAAASGGHVIQDGTNTTYAQRSNLKFVGQPAAAIDIADDETGDATVVTAYALKVYHNGTFFSYAVALNFVDDT